MEKLFLGSAFVFELHIFRLSWVTPSWLDPLCPHGMRASNALINLLASQILESCESATLQPGNRVDYLLPQISVSSQNGAVKHAVGWPHSIWPDHFFSRMSFATKTFINPL